MISRMDKYVYIGVKISYSREGWKGEIPKAELKDWQWEKMMARDLEEVF